MDNVSELISSLDALSFRVSLLSGALILTYISVIIGCIVSYFKNIPSNGELGDADYIYEKGDYKLLIDRCNKLKLERPNNLESHWYLALCYYQQSKYELALIEFAEVERISPTMQSDTEAYKFRIESMQKNKSESHH